MSSMKGRNALPGSGPSSFAACVARVTSEPRRLAWGVHRYGGYFTGDLSPYWSTLEMLVPFNVRSGNMLVPYVT